MKHRGSVEAIESVVAPTGTYSASLTISGVPVATGTGVIDHGALTGLDSDDHPQYSLADGSRAFSGPVGGIDPVASSDLTTRNYVDGEVVAVSGHLQTEIDGVPVPTFQEVYDASTLPLLINSGKPMWIIGNPMTIPLTMHVLGNTLIQTATSGTVDIESENVTIDSENMTILSDNVVISGTQPTGSVYKLFAEDLTISGSHGLWVDASVTIRGSANVQNVIPQADDIYDVGSISNHFRTIYLGNNNGEALVFEDAVTKGVSTDYTFNLGGGDSIGAGYTNTFTFLMEDMTFVTNASNTLIFDVGTSSVIGTGSNAVSFRSEVPTLGTLTLDILFYSPIGGQGNDMGFRLTNPGGAGGGIAYNLTFNNNTNPGQVAHGGFSSKQINFQFDGGNVGIFDEDLAATALFKVKTRGHDVSANIWGAFLVDTAQATALYNNNTTMASTIISEPNIDLNGFALTNAATLYINGAPTEGTSVNAAIWAPSGPSIFDTVTAVSGTFSQSLTVSGVPVVLDGGGGSFDELQGAFTAQVFGA